MSTAETLDVAAVRARFTALQRRLAFFDGPGGTQCPDEVIDAIAELPARTTTRTSALRTRPRGAPTRSSSSRTRRRVRFLGCSGDEVAFGQSMTSLNFLLTRALGARARSRRRGAS